MRFVVLLDCTLEGVRLYRLLHQMSTGSRILLLLLIVVRRRLFLDQTLFLQEFIVLLTNAALLLFELLLYELFVLLNDLLFLTNAFFVFLGIAEILLVLGLWE